MFLQLGFTAKIRVHRRKFDATPANRLITRRDWAIVAVSMRHQTPSINNSGTVLHVDDYVTLVADFDGVIVRMTRSSIPHPSVHAMEDSYLQVARTFDRYGRRGRCLLVDTRNVSGRNDPDYDAAFRRARDRIDAGLLRIAVLLRSQTGMLQMMRLSEEDGTVRLITMSEKDAVDYLRHGTVPGAARPATAKNQAK
jgi:hypothetical protein